ncbi:hypothetical protein D9758_016389 [Tetrapyrgos nigripes]|uniref:Uncharacterized protein n=1 Tax=Tetrapyrgos nigripes TaxID=182062 RepID=A0A8H5CA14_9AGAR|nr:hypothetical protein D9758_016389 [Tetrapyrgos nigripes]
MNVYLECYLANEGVYTLVYYLAFPVGETVILLLTVFKAFSTWRSTRSLTHSALITSLYRDGILFYFALLPFSALNALAVFYLPPPWQTHLFDTPLRVMHTILTCRLILRIHQNAEHEEEESLESISALEFANPSTTDHTTQV